ncbi:DUF84 family protein [Candidatus Absconditicoccus praedator]|uniref:DUF84 family protein n=1 Tax=Candidatus Absconditicoccus praedator TaxID=2735562 RepID=UPI001E410F0B|nr:inosine/xanthosine triphosphatase [Candidatus Absconditicoccus praedator]UFX82633.1 DUF84 family protein [Candidatus Absconditicoccus praedator]
MKIAIGTQNPAKIEAIKIGIDKCSYTNNQDIEFITNSAESNVSDMPKSLEENIRGAENRSIDMQKKHNNADLYIGMEGGTSYINGKAYLFGVVCILDKNGKKHIGISNMMEVPEVFRKRIYENGEELGVVLEELTGIQSASKKNGAFGAWSDDNLTRTDQFVYAFLSAIPPFFNNFYNIE